MKEKANANKKKTNSTHETFADLVLKCGCGCGCGCGCLLPPLTTS